MRTRALDPNDDYNFGNKSTFLVDSPEAVAQNVKTRLRLFAGEWFLDKTEGLNLTNILGAHTRSTRDVEVRQRILGTKGVVSIAAYASSVDVTTRAFTVNATIVTAYGQAAVVFTGSF